ncbi:MAG: glycosyltransferase family 4 protein [Gemmatimonadaceae bacterium]
MRITIVNWQDRENPQAGGAEAHLHEIFGRLAARGHEVTLLCSGWEGAPSRTTLDGLDVHRVGTRYTFPMNAWPYWRRTLAQHEADVLVEDINKVPLLTPWWRARRTVALVHHLFGTTAFDEAPAPIAAAVWASERPLRWFYRGVPFQAVSESTRSDLVARGIPAGAITVIHNGVDIDALTPDPAARSSAPGFLYLGRLKRYKQVDVILRAFARLADPRATLDIAGPGDDRPRLEQLARSLDLGHRVRFLGFVPEAQKLMLLRSAWALVFTSPKEGWGITNLEAAACGTPVLASDSPGLRDSVRHGETGYLVPHGDVSALSAAMRSLIDAPDLVASLGRRARAFAETLTWERAARETEAHLALVTGEEVPPWK